MNKDQLNQDIKDQFSQLQTEVGQSLTQLLNNDVVVSLNPDEAVSLPELFADSPNQIGIHFVTGEYGHLFLLLPALATQLYAWMVGEEPASNITTDHLDGLKEVVQQVYQQINKSPVNEAPLSVDGVEVVQAESFDDVNHFVNENEGVTNSFSLSVSDVNFQVVHHLIPLGTDEPKYEEKDINVQPAEFETLKEKSVGKETTKNIDMLMDVELEISVELGRKKSLISDVLKLGKGSILELEKSAGENLDVLVNGKKLAEGEVVIIDEHFGIRITQLVSPKERVNLLK